MCALRTLCTADQPGDAALAAHLCACLAWEALHVIPQQHSTAQQLAQHGAHMRDTADFLLLSVHGGSEHRAGAVAQAFEQELAIVPVLNKVDLPSAEPDRVAEQMQQARTAPKPMPTNSVQPTEATSTALAVLMRRRSAAPQT